jgi:hypothetical protein
MSKWKHPYVIKVCPGPRPEFHLMALVYGNPNPSEKEPLTLHHYYRKVESYPSLEKALEAKRKAYDRLTT